MNREKFLPFALPDLDVDEEREVIEVLRSGWLTTGPKVKAFEAEFAAIVGARHAVAVSSCTAALHLSLLAAGVGEDDEVITSPYTFAATAEVIRHVGARPVFVDIDAATFNIDVAAVARAITSRTRAIIPVHLAGLPADLDAIREEAGRRRISVIEDAAHAFPARYKGRVIGSISEFTCFSFYATKGVTTAEGGMICTDDGEAAQRCRIAALHGLGHDAWRRETSQQPWFYEIVAAGFKYNMPDVCGAIGLAQLRKNDRMHARRREIAERYNAAFAGLAALQLPADSADVEHSWHLYMLRLNDGHLGIGRDEFVLEMRKRNIGTSVHFIPLHLHPYYRATLDLKPSDFPVAVREYAREFSLPIYSKMTDADVEDVIDAVTDIVASNTRRAPLASGTIS